MDCNQRRASCTALVDLRALAATGGARERAIVGQLGAPGQSALKLLKFYRRHSKRFLTG
jgi:hypothetical protein